MDRQEFYKEGSKVLTDAEYKVIYGAFEDAEETCNNVSANLREAITGVMAKLLEKRGSRELTTEHFIITNRNNVVRVIEPRVDSTEETPLDDIESLDKLMDIVNEII
jgi:hypothetical protein